MRKTTTGGTIIEKNESYTGEPLEIILSRITQTKEPIDASAPIIYTERKDGVLPQYDIRTDKWEIAQEAMGKVAATQIAKRDGNIEKTEVTPSATADKPDNTSDN